MARAKFLEDNKDVDGAIEMYGIVVKRFDKQPIANVARLHLANLLHKTGGQKNLATAQILLKDYLQSQAEKTSADEALYLLGWVMHDQGNSDQAVVRFQRLVDQYPASKYWSDAAFRIAQQHIRKGEEAQSRCDRESNRCQGKGYQRRAFKKCFLVLVISRHKRLPQRRTGKKSRR